MALERGMSDLPADQQQLGQTAKKLEEDLAALRVRLDRYFLGLDRKHPGRDIEDYRRRLLKLMGEFLRNTALKFRVQSLLQKFQSYEQLWQRSLREIEEGTYSRDLFKLRWKRARVSELASPPVGDKASGAGGKGLEVSADGSELTSERIKKIYEAFIAAKKRCNESTEGITFDAVAQSLRKQLPRLKLQRGATSVDFKVTIKDGKAVLEALMK